MSAFRRRIMMAIISAISSCFGAGYWNNIEGWSNSDGWIN